MSETGRPPVLKNYDLRRRIVALTVMPALLIGSLIVVTPLVITMGTAISITWALIATIVTEIGVIAWALWYGGLLPNWKESLFFKNFKWKHLLIGLLVGQAAYWGLQLVAIIFGAFGLTFESSDTSTSVYSLAGVEAIIVIFLLVPFVGPFLEEFLFRGVIIGSLQQSKWKAPWISILISAVTFGVLHVQGFSTFTDFALLGWITLMGAAFAWLYLKTKSFWSAFTAHAVYNLTSSIVVFIGMSM